MARVLLTVLAVAGTIQSAIERPREACAAGQPGNPVADSSPNGASAESFVRQWWRHEQGQDREGREAPVTIPPQAHFPFQSRVTRLTLEDDGRGAARIAACAVGS